MSNETDFIKELLNPKKRERAFGKLLDNYQERLYWHIRKIVVTHENADDVLQNTFLRIYKSLPNFHQKSTLHTWMYRIAYNESIRFLELQKKKQHSSLDEENSYYLNSLEDDVYFDGSEAQFKLNQVINELPEKQKIVFQLKYFDDLKFREIAEILELNESTLKSLYYTSVKYIENNVIKIQPFLKKEV
ncbi:RNA polymerase sigma factor [Lutibacter sp. TH_r2]|uniref:RNA polymerase sigma factor n=1 Tax=Lutibacter sp. TH_r2 TaxID=3082083 RepID=UPI002955A4EE|nr:RNA polymerase sigma factor [Lutibacter sp. TH_r2]MDV7187587.1 RNA polymerase sigma factor [Lutibacter sp. TH_r2]